MSDLAKIFKRYAAFEAKVINEMTQQLGSFCRDCAGGCCTKTICREARESPFLRELRGRVQARLRYDATTGWQRRNGCALKAARPPVCHEFICNEIEQAYPDALERYLLKVLCRLVTHIGRKAKGPLHLVEIASAAGLHEVPLERFRKRLREAEAALKIVKSFFAHKSLSPESLPVLAKVHPPSPSVRKMIAFTRKPK